MEPVQCDIPKNWVLFLQVQCISDKHCEVKLECLVYQLSSPRPLWSASIAEDSTSPLHSLSSPDNLRDFVSSTFKSLKIKTNRYLTHSIFKLENKAPKYVFLEKTSVDKTVISTTVLAFRQQFAKEQPCSNWFFFTCKQQLLLNPRAMKNWDVPMDSQLGKQ